MYVFWASAIQLFPYSMVKKLKYIHCAWMITLDTFVSVSSWLLLAEFSKHILYYYDIDVSEHK